jgi:hypothetical protein
MSTEEAFQAAVNVIRSMPKDGRLLSFLFPVFVFVIAE